MAQSLQLDIKTTSDVPQAMDRAKAATAGFGKQVEDIKKKFGTSFKDIFLSFLGPMALLTAAIAFITKMIAEQQQKREEANRAAIAGTNDLMSAEDRYYANKLNNEKKLRETTEQAKIARSKVTADFLDLDPRGQKLYDAEFREKFFGQPFKKFKRGLLSDDPDIQEKVQAMIAGDIKKSAPAGAAGSALPNSTPFKAPEGFSNVVGVGSNPVLTAMDEQLTQLKVMSDLLAAIERAGGGGGVPVDFTKKETPTLK